MSPRLPARVLRAIRDGLISITYPQDCRVCGRSVESWDNGVACDRCWRERECDGTLRAVICKKCGAPLRLSSLIGVEASTQCGKCEAFPFEAARAAGLY